MTGLENTHVDPVPHIWGRSLNLSDDLRRVHLPKGAYLRPQIGTPAFAHILESGLVSSSILFGDGRSAVVRTVAAGDVLEIDELLGCSRRQVTSKVLMPGVAIRIAFNRLREMLQRDQRLQDQALRILGTRTLELEQISVCNCFHSLEQRLARHLLFLAGKVSATSLQVTQDELASQLGVARTSIGVSAGGLREKGAIGFVRGSVVVKNKERLEQCSCECHHALRELQERLLSSVNDIDERFLEEPPTLQSSPALTN